MLSGRPPSERSRQLVRLLREALEQAGGTHTVMDVLDAVNEGAAVLWEAASSVVVTELVDYPRLRALRIWLVAGDLDEILGMEARVTDFAMRHHASRLEFMGRPGWARVLKGWRQLSCAVKEI